MRPPDGLADVDEVSGVVVARLSGEVDLDGAPTVEARLSALANRPVTGLVVDLTDVRYLDSSAVRVLFLLADRLALGGRELHVVVPRGSRLSRLVSIIQLDAVVAVHDTVGEACAALAGAAGPRAERNGRGVPSGRDDD